VNSLSLGIDGGNKLGKTVGPFGVDMFNTAICDWFDRDVEETFGSDDMEFEIDGRQGFSGTIARYEDEYGGSGMFGTTKYHEDNKIRILLAVFRYIQKYAPSTTHIKIVTGQPITQHNAIEKQGIIDMLMGEHTIKVNGIRGNIYVKDVRVSPEGSGAFWSNPQAGTIRILDIGSGTVNAATIIDKRHINSASNTFNFGVETVKNKNDMLGMARGIIRNTTILKWQKHDIVWVCGGIAEQILPYIQHHYPNSILLSPQLNGVMRLKPVYANACGFYDLAKRTFK